MKPKSQINNYDNKEAIFLLIYLASIKPNDKEKCFLQIARYNFYFKT